MRSQAYQYLQYLFVKYFILVFKNCYNKSGQLDHKNNYKDKYFKIGS